jgi:hypothetical protein
MSGFDAGGEDGFYYPAIENPARLSRGIQGVEGGRMSASYGEMTLINNDGGLDGMADHYFDGRTLKLFIVRTKADRGSAVEILNAQVESVAIERDRVSVRLRDRLVTLAKPFSTNKYLGDNVLPDGVEGTEDIKDQQKPIIYGRVALMAPVCVNTSKLIYQVSANKCQIINVFDAGAYMTRDDDLYRTVEAMIEDEPDPGSYRIWATGGMFRLGSSPYGTLSVCVADSFEPSRISAAGLLKRIIRDAYANRSGEALYDTTIPADGYDWHWKDLQKLDEQNAASLGLVVQDGETTASLIDRICQSVGAFWGFDAFGKLRVVRLDAPSGSHVAILNDENLLTLERDADWQMPYQSVTVRSDNNYVPQDKSSLVGAVTEGQANWLKSETRDQTYTDNDVKSQRLLSEASTFESLLNSTAIAQAEAKRRVDLFATRRDYINMTVANPLAYLNIVDLGSVVKVESSRFGFETGKLFTVVGVGFDFQQNTFDIQAFG